MPAAEIVTVEVGELLEILRTEIGGSIGYTPEALDPNMAILKLGLDSAAAIRLGARIEHCLGVRLEIADLLRIETIADLARLIHRRRLLVSMMSPPTNFASTSSTRI